MKKKIEKLKNIFKKGPVQPHFCKSGAGFVILFAVTISSILLAVALGAANIAYREVKFSTSAKDTNDAFFAADTGIESALLQDKAPNSICAPAPSCSFSFDISQLGSSAKSCVKVTANKTASPFLTTIVSKGYNTGSAAGGACKPPVNSVERQLEVNY
jgi:hypothetical protein